ncbi:MAG: glycosyltransferase family 4 protein [Desulfobulbus sp.]|nr:glycosyltransferase family 4 protein [Desulfobulbus sp.]
MFIDEFGLKKESVIALPLAIDDDLFLGFNVDEPTKNASLTIFFVGTLIPLHGITTVLKTARLLMPDPRFRFCLIGDGQEAQRIEHEAATFDQKRFSWIKGWVDLPQIAAKMNQADICLGIFGGEGKASRVLPFKIYMYLAGGKAVVSQDTFSLPESTPSPPILTANPANPQDIARSIIRLADDVRLRRQLEREARAYYKHYLGWQRIADIWRRLLNDITVDRPKSE